MSDISAQCSRCSMEATSQNGALFYCAHHAGKSTIVTKMACNQRRKLGPLFFVFGIIAIISLLRQFLNGWDSMVLMMDMMGYFFILFGLLKLYDLDAFAHGFAQYDVVAKRVKYYGYIYPFLELTLGAMYLAGFMFAFQQVLVLILAVSGMYSAYKVLLSNEEIPCVCLGTLFLLPMTWVTFAENAFMAFMGAIMLFWM